MPFQKGERANPKGRPKGSPNKHTAELKEAILAAAEAANPAGLVAYLTDLAQNNPNVFVPLLGKILPKDVTLDVKRELLVRVIDHTGAGPVMQDREE